MSSACWPSGETILTPDHCDVILRGLAFARRAAAMRSKISGGPLMVTLATSVVVVSPSSRK
ncbi:MAG: hypothetical protein PHZ19_03970 [Candidatus Thermoplasmatota archaeon]|nr:hypothetical protein [Candidatus Thermoplasmatota archaeon]